MSATLSLVLALILLVVWVLLTVIYPLGVAAVHLALGASVTLLVRWWALRDRQPAG